MRKLITLTRIILKSGYGNVGQSDARKKRQIWIWVVLGLSLLSLIPVAVEAVRFLSTMFSALIPLHQDSVLWAILMLMIVFTILFIGILSVPVVFYLSRDLEHFMTWPLSAWQIIGAKFIATLLQEYLFALAIFVPVTVAWIHAGGFTFDFLIMFPVVFLLVPAMALAVTVIIIMILMRYIPFLRNRDRFTTITSFIAIIGAVGLNLAINQSVDMNPNKIYALLSGQDQSLITLVERFAPPLKYAALAITNHSYMDLFIFIVIVAGLIAFMLLVAKQIYFAGALNMQSGGHGRKLTDRSLQKQLRRLSARSALRRKEWLLLVRTPAWLTNNLLAVVLMPVIIVVSVMFKIGSDHAQLDSLVSFLTTAITLPMYFFFAFALGILLTAMHNIASTTISREGSNIDYMKIWPVPYAIQLDAKLDIAMNVSVSVGGLLIIGASILLHVSVPTLLIMLMAMGLGSWLTSLLGLFLDLTFPKLVWENEAVPIKQNFTTFIYMMLCFVLSGISIWLGFKLIEPWMWAICVLLIALSVMLRTLLMRYGAHVLDTRL